MQDVGRREFWMLVAMALLVLGMGIYPKPVTDMTEASAKALLEHVAASKLE
jgi:NADH-quinone oxidoreductase subunit M